MIEHAAWLADDVLLLVGSLEGVDPEPDGVFEVEDAQFRSRPAHSPTVPPARMSSPRSCSKRLRLRALRDASGSAERSLAQPTRRTTSRTSRQSHLPRFRASLRRRAPESSSSWSQPSPRTGLRRAPCMHAPTLRGSARCCATGSRWR